MGQYYKFMNIDKKQNCQRNWHGVKLMEHSYVGNNYCDDILRLLSNEWKGDRVIHVGDYAEPKDGTTTQNIIEKIMNENDIKYSLYSLCDQFDEVVPSSKDEIRYVYNLDKKEYVDYFNLIHPHLNVGGFIACDNVLSHEEKTQTFIDAINNHPDYENVVLNLPAGLSLGRKVR